MALMYRILSLQKTVEPMYFYIHTVFGFHAVLLMSLYGTTWLLSGSWLAGILSAAFYIFNNADTTRVWFSIAGRESWAFPFWYMQMFLLTVFFHPNLHRNLKVVTVVLLCICTFCFTLTWQFAQFALLLQAMTLFGCAVLDVIPAKKIRQVWLIQAGSLLAVCVCQFFNKMVLCSLVLSFIPSAMLTIAFKEQFLTRRSLPSQLAGLVLNVILVMMSMLLFNKIIKRPQLAYHAISAAVFGCLAVSTKRFKYLWTPHMCVLAAAGVADFEAWKILLKKLHIDLSEAKALPTTLEEVKQRNAFHDPDTVQLMEWIKKETPATAAFTGSMQLMAGVKLCTGRPITNHPHYEDRDLRIRTKQLYQIYGRRHPKEVHAILKAHGTRYIIVENSICYERGQVHGVGCRLRDLVDMSNHHVVEGGIRGPKDHPAAHPRFCHAVQSGAPQYRIYFTVVFQNKTFRTYKVS
ncbi:PREDICTED: probable C-mannosyltransferase DPY19L3 [Branchiostoma belcheri]|uniref:Probable C-mannosyltransferase DPY19L3 n=1 Tax=Branchiostoma belcheri TaxID=7741 RepID=A0A6P4YKU8_BRABE|nr:PREDICTED: probable C-mannosyltransferase DPY19L3 [Branchiostoma belcheri]